MAAAYRLQRRQHLLASIAQALSQAVGRLLGRSGAYRPEKNYMRGGSSDSRWAQTAERQKVNDPR